MKPAIHFLARCGFIGGLFVVVGCAHYPANARLTQYDPDAGYRNRTLVRGDNSESLLVMLAFSGGGHRAAALSYGVLEELARTDIVWEGKGRRLLDEVDMISAVSGGSFTAAYYALFGDEIFTEYEKVFLKQNIQRQLFWRLLSPVNWPRYASPYFDRSDMAASFYDRRVFRGKTFGDLVRDRRPPFLVLNATDMSSGAHFEFTQDAFDLLCSDLSSFPVGRAVAASSAVPVVLTPITINNYAGHCGFTEPAWVQTKFAEADPSSRFYQKVQELRSFQDTVQHPYLHLLDGALADNLGLRAPMEDTLALGGTRETLRFMRLDRPRKVVIIVVNATVHHDLGWDNRAISPSLVQVSVASSNISIDRYSFETMQAFRDAMRQWEAELNRADSEPVQFYPIEISFQRLTDPKERRYFDRLPTSFNLPPGALDRLRKVAGRLLRENKTYQTLLHDLTERNTQ
jgi:NTE family protein